MFKILGFKFGIKDILRIITVIFTAQNKHRDIRFNYEKEVAVSATLINWKVAMFANKDILVSKEVIVVLNEIREQLQLYYSSVSTGMSYVGDFLSLLEKFFNLNNVFIVRLLELGVEPQCINSSRQLLKLIINECILNPSITVYNIDEYVLNMFKQLDEHNIMFPTIWYTVQDNMPPEGIFVLGHYCGNNWYCASDPTGVNYKVISLFSIDNVEGEPSYYFKEFGVGRFELTEIDRWQYING